MYISNAGIPPARTRSREANRAARRPSRFQRSVDHSIFTLYARRPRPSALPAESSRVSPASWPSRRRGWPLPVALSRQSICYCFCVCGRSGSCGRSERNLPPPSLPSPADRPSSARWPGGGRCARGTLKGSLPHVPVYQWLTVVCKKIARQLMHWLWIRFSAAGCSALYFRLVFRWKIGWNCLNVLRYFRFLGFTWGTFFFFFLVEVVCCWQFLLWLGLNDNVGNIKNYWKYFSFVKFVSLQKSFYSNHLLISDSSLLRKLGFSFVIFS